MTYSVTISGEKEVNRYLTSILGNSNKFGGRLTWVVAQKNAKHIRAETNRFKKPRGVMRASIRPVKLRDGHGVTATNYGQGTYNLPWVIDVGRRAGNRPPAPAGGKIQRYAGGNLLAGYKMSRTIGKHGTMPTYFIRMGLAKARPDWEKSLSQHLDYYIKSGGRTL